jgi:hypothetical protein
MALHDGQCVAARNAAWWRLAQQIRRVPDNAPSMRFNGFSKSPFRISHAFAARTRFISRIWSGMSSF